MNIADAQERRDVRLMRLRGQRITEEYDRQHLILSDPGADLQVAPQARARRPGGDQREVLQRVPVLADELSELLFPLVMSDQCDKLLHWPHSDTPGRQFASSWLASYDAAQHTEGPIPGARTGE